MYHHFKGSGLNRAEQIQRFIVDRIINSKVVDEERENSVAWELKHSSSSLQVGRLLALKRGLDLELVEVICALHDIYAIDTGFYKNHAAEGALIARAVLKENGNFFEAEIELICEAIHHHSDKHIYSDKPYVELIKDADILDCSLYEGTAAYYQEFKPAEICREYFLRAQSVSQELDIPLHPKFNIDL